MADNPIIRYFRPGETLSISSGKSYSIILRQPRFVIDGHSHIQSGACCPLPLIWIQKPIVQELKPNRKFANAIAFFVMGKGGRLQRKTTEKIGAKLVEEILRTYGTGSILRSNANEDFFSSSIIMTMDMDYAQIAGFNGSMIYHATVDGVIYYNRQTAFAREDEGEVIHLSGERLGSGWVYQQYKAQIDATISAVLKCPWVLIPMFHYDPRRWCNASGGELDKKLWKHGPWDYPFEYVATLRKAGIFIGFKMYPPLGYKPLDYRLPHLSEFYARCEADGIPILTHCSPGGLITHEAEFYHQLDRVDPATGVEEKERNIGYDPTTPKGYFFDEYVHPKNWRKVLLQYPKLKLCLAHCGGDEWKDVGIESDWIQEVVILTKEFPNVYTDMSCYNLGKDAMKNNVQVFLNAVCSDADYQHLKNKLIFGVDWYLSMIAGAPAYKEYVESFYTMMKEIDEEQWQMSALVNPARFYGLDEKKKLGNMYQSLSLLIDDDPKGKRLLKTGYEKVLKVSDKIVEIEKTYVKTSGK